MPRASPSGTGTESVEAFEDDDFGGAERPEDLAAGARVAGRYTVMSVLGRGGYATVYLAHDETTATRVALKVLRADRLGQVALKRMAREADTARHFEHSRLVKVIDHGRFGDNAYLAMEVVEGQTLRERLQRGALSTEEAVRVCIDVLDGLSALHRMGVVHRDVKPSNILLDAAGRAKLGDFGLVTRWADDQSRATQSHAIVGTLEYVSPEQALGEDLDGRSDLYALGVVLFEVLSGSPLHGARSSLGMLVAHLTRPAPDVRASREDIPDWLAAVVARLLAKSRDERYATADEVLADLKSRRARRVARAPRGNRRTIALAAGVMVCALVAMGWKARSNVASRPQTPQTPSLAGAEVKAGLLRGLDTRGSVMWTHDFGLPLNDSDYSAAALQFMPSLRVADIDDDGRNEVLIVAATRQDDLRQFVVLESDGTERFRRRPGRKVTFGGKDFEGFTAGATYFYVDAKGRRRLFLLSMHRPWFPSVLEELDPRGRVVSEYFASGIQMGVTRLTVRGQDALALSGFHNETRGGSVTFLSLDHPSGRAPAMNPDFLCTSCLQEDPLAMVVVPRSDIIEVVAGKEGTASIERVLRLDGGVIDLAAIQGNPQASVAYSLAPDLSKLLDVRVSEGLKIMHDDLFKAGRLGHAFGERDAARLRRALIWDGRQWAPVPGAGSGATQRAFD